MFDIISAGELLADFISTDFAETFGEVENYKRLMGGSPANLAMNMARLGGRSCLVASVGVDDLGGYLIDFVQKAGVHCEHIQRVKQPSTLILVTRSKEVSNFEPYRGADCRISSVQFADALLAGAKIFHTTCFALSLNPARKAILQAAEQAAKLGTQLSIDANYAGKIWPNRAEARRTVAQYLSHGALVKMSEVDWERLYGSKMTNPEAASGFLMSLGATEVCLTMGSEGCFVRNAHEQHFLPSRRIEVKDTTGAGDAFWSGYLTARNDGHPLLHRAMSGRRMAEIKLGHFGPLTADVDRRRIYEDFS